MTPIIIALLILAIGAAVLIVAGIFTAKLLKKRKEGLDKRQDAITRREGKLDSREIQLDRRETDIAEREKRAPQGVLPGDRLEIVTVNRPIQKLRTETIIEFDKLFGEYGSMALPVLQDFIADYTEQVKDGLRDRLCETARDLVLFSFCDDVCCGVREITAELWVAGGGSDNGVS